MLLAIENLVDPATLAAVQEEASGLAFEDGSATAGRFAKTVKANDQAATSDARDAILSRVQQALLANPVFASAARPAVLTPLILSRYRMGQTYGLHVDNAVMGGLRTDLSFTLFLSDPDTYQGGALVIEDSFEARAIKLPAGSLILYPSTTLHRVEPVAEGTRLAVVGWVQSQIRSAEQREILFDLDRAVEAAFAEGGKTSLFDTLTKTRSNLLRMWVGL
jgi:PKHD-type hydroxylase